MEEAGRREESRLKEQQGLGRKGDMGTGPGGVRRVGHRLSPESGSFLKSAPQVPCLPHPPASPAHATRGTLTRVTCEGVSKAEEGQGPEIRSHIHGWQEKGAAPPGQGRSCGLGRDSADITALREGAQNTVPNLTPLHVHLQHTHDPHWSNPTGKQRPGSLLVLPR